MSPLMKKRKKDLKKFNTTITLPIGFKNRIQYLADKEYRRPSDWVRSRVVRCIEEEEGAKR